MHPNSVGSTQRQSPAVVTVTSTQMMHSPMQEDAVPAGASGAGERRAHALKWDPQMFSQNNVHHLPHFAPHRSLGSMVSPRPRHLSPPASPVKETRLNRAKSTTTVLGAFTLKGQKVHSVNWINQDAYLAKQLGDGLVLLAAIDGHGEHGHVVANYVQNFVLENARALGGGESNTAFQQLFSVLQGSLAKGCLSRESQYSGATTTIALVDTFKERMTVAYVGDSRLCILDAAGKPVFEIVDHTVSGEDESHVLATGGDVRTETVCGITARRVYLKGQQYPGLAMSRSLGDCVAHTLGVRAEPTIVTVPFTAGQTVVVASDGVWEHMTAGDVAAVVGKDDTQTAASAAQDLVHAARWRWGNAPNIDDITSVVLRNSSEWIAPLCASPSRCRALTC